MLLITCLAVNVRYINAHSTAEEVDYREDFEDRLAEGWELESGWQIFEDNGNQVLEGVGHAWASAERSYDNYRLSFRLKLVRGRIHLVYRTNNEGRYFIGFENAGSVLNKQYWPSDFQENLVRKDVYHANNTWHQVEIVGEGDKLTLVVNGVTEWSYTDPDPILFGSFSFETLEDSQAYIDDVIVTLEQTAPVVLQTATLPTDTGEVVAEPAVFLPAASLEWVRTGGPIGGLGYDVRMSPENPDKMFVTDSFAGIFVSKDGGKNWVPSNKGIELRDGSTGDVIPVFSATIDPSQPNTIWAGTQNKLGIYKSIDGGETWQRMVNGISERDGISFRGFAVDPSNSDVVYAAAEISSWAGGKLARNGREFDLTRGVVYKTIDGGRNWFVIWSGENLARYIWIDPRNTDVLYVSTGIFDREANNSDPQRGDPGGEGILKSIDGGQTWEHINNGLGNLYVGSLFMHPGNPDILIAGTGNNQYYYRGGVYITTDGGALWKQVLSEFAITAVEFAQSDPSVAYAGSERFIYRSEDGGNTWGRISESSEAWGTPGIRGGFPIDFQVDPRNPDKLFTNAYGGGNFLSEDGGKTWVASSRGYTGSLTQWIAVDPNQPARVLVASRSGLFLSLNGGDDWEGICGSPAYFMEFSAIAIDPADTQHFVAASRGDFVIVQSRNNGSSWRVVMKLEEDSSNLITWKTLSFAPSSPKIVYAGTTNFIRFREFNYLGTGKGVYKSIDGGNKWQPANDELSLSENIVELEVDPGNPEVVYAGTTNQGLIKTENGGSSWYRVKNGLPDGIVLSISINPSDTNFIAIGIARQGVYLSKDGGATWSRSSNGMPPEASPKAILFDPAHPEEIMYASDFFSGVYRSVNSGKRWELINNGLHNRAINSLAISGDGLHLYAGTEGAGVYRLDLNGQAPPPVPIEIIPTPTLQAEVIVEETATAIISGAATLENEGVEISSEDEPGFNLPGLTIILIFVIGLILIIGVLVVIILVWSKKRGKK